MLVVGLGMYWYFEESTMFDDGTKTTSTHNSQDVSNMTDTNKQTVTGISPIPTRVSSPQVEAQTSLDFVMDEEFAKEDAKDQELTINALQRLVNTNETLIKATTPYLIASGEMSSYQQVNDYLINTYGVQLWTAPIVPDEGNPEISKVIYHFKARGMYFDVKYLHEHTDGDTTYEYWVALVGGEDWAGVDRQQIFYLVERDNTRDDEDTTDARQIVVRTKDFHLPSNCLMLTISNYH